MVRPEAGGVDLVGEAGQGAYVDAAAWRGPRPDVPGLEFRSEFDALYARKLYTNNAGHALLAYEGAMAGCKFIWEALAVPEIGSDLRELLGLSATALARRYGMAHGGLERHVDELVSVRYANRDLADPVARAARDPLRKLRPDERLVGLARLLESCGLPTRGVARVIAAALRYRQDQDAGSARLAHLLAERGPEGVLREVCGLGPAEAVSREILAEYRKGEQK
jgi:mannitol-1-phosphate 5-dehydrogenase